MNLALNIGIALDGLRANKLRAALTMLGILIGVSAVIVLMSIGQGTQASVTSRISALGTNLIFVRPGAPQQGGVRQAQGSAVSLTLDDALALEDAPSVIAVAPELQTQAQVVARGRNARTRILGVTDVYQEVRNYDVADGEFITAQQVSSRALVAVLGASIADTLFPNGDAVGQLLRINVQQFRVVGVLQSKGGTALGIQDDQVLVPITTAMSRLTSQRTARGNQTVSTINVQARDEKSVQSAKDEITDILRTRHRITGEDDFTVTSQEDTLATLNQITGVFTAFLGSIAGISLVVGGIGIMNIMLVSVTERTREIGIRKALGAKRKDILSQFLVEATVISVLGGGLGLLLGVVISYFVSGLDLNGQALRTEVSPTVLLMAVTVSALVGLFFGIYPAAQASKLNPIDALRYE